MDPDLPPPSSAPSSPPPSPAYSGPLNSSLTRFKESPGWWLPVSLGVLVLVCLVTGPIIGLVLAIMGVAVLAKMFPALLKKAFQVDLTRPAGFFVLRLAISVAVAVGCLVWAYHTENGEEFLSLKIRAEVSANPDRYGSYRTVEPGPAYTGMLFFIFLLHLVGWLAVASSVLRLYQLYRYMEQQKIGFPTAIPGPGGSVTPAPSPPEDIETKLASLTRMRDQGVLTEEEYKAKRAEVLARF